MCRIPDADTAGVADRSRAAARSPTSAAQRSSGVKAAGPGLDIRMTDKTASIHFRKTLERQAVPLLLPGDPGVPRLLHDCVRGALELLCQPIGLARG